MNKKILTISVLLILGFTFSVYAGGIKVLHEKTFSVEKGELLELFASTGNVKITTWENDEVYVKVFGNSRAEEKVEFSFDETSRGVKIKAEKRGSNWFNWGSGIKLNFEIRVPSRFDTEIKTAGGDIFVADLEGENELKTSGGDLTLFNLKGALEAKTSGGKIELEGHEGKAYLGTSGGDIDVKGQDGDIEAKTSGGDIEMNVKSGRVRGSTSGGDVRLVYSGENEGIALSTSGGDIRMRLPSNIKAEIDCTTSGGRVRNNLNTTKIYRDKKTSLEAELNGGGALIKARTSGGDVTLDSF
ncbi:MAG: hypothetical protein SCALA702_05500 [Melioribacteraceae bacterium]|nr:MAG: hypothetical protein SCALA702_05500 [Melioribacteraceae bacterium]